MFYVSLARPAVGKARVGFLIATLCDLCSEFSFFFFFQFVSDDDVNVIIREVLGNRGCFVGANWKLMGTTPGMRVISYDFVLL